MKDWCSYRILGNAQYSTYDILKNPLRLYKLNQNDIDSTISVCSSDRYFRKGVYLRKSSLNVFYTFPRIHFIDLLIK
jgi:hypothetical protein